MAKLSLRNDAAIAEAVDGLLAMFGVPDDSNRADPGFLPPGRPPLGGDEGGAGAPSAEIEALWSRRKKHPQA